LAKPRDGCIIRLHCRLSSCNYRGFIPIDVVGKQFRNGGKVRSVRLRLQDAGKVDDIVAGSLEICSILVTTRRIGRRTIAVLKAEPDPRKVVPYDRPKTTVPRSRANGLKIYNKRQNFWNDRIRIRLPGIGKLSDCHEINTTLWIVTG